ncbi:YopX family protein [Bacteroides fragilis]
MNREIIFRGKSTNNGKWVYAELHGFGMDLFNECVQENTVGQFTGLHDKNGKKIYEGDIVQLDYITTIGKHRIGLSFEVKWCTQEGCWVGWDGFVENALQQTCKMFVVKGNIYDNPELMKEEL